MGKSQASCELLSGQQFEEDPARTLRLLPPPSPETPGGVGVGGNCREDFRYGGKLLSG